MSTTPTVTINGEKVELPEARKLLGIPSRECFGCYLGDCAPQMHDKPNVCDYGDAFIYTLPSNAEG